MKDQTVMRFEDFGTNRILHRVIMFALSVLVFSPPAVGQACSPAQVAPKASKADLAVFHSDVNLVLVPVTVTDRLNRPILNLESKDFVLLDDKQPQRIEYFFKEDAPISVGLVLDFSGSMQPKMESLRKSIREFFNNANPADDYYVVAVSTHPKAIAQGTQSLEEIEAAISHEQPNGWTSLLDAVHLTVKMMENSRYSRRVILIVSDGGDNDSRFSSGRIVKEIEEANADVYAVAIFDAPLLFMKPLEERLGRRLLTRLTDVTGGRTISVNSADKVPTTFSDLSREMRTRYVLGYRPSQLKHDGHWRKIKVGLSVPIPQSRIQMYSRKGYVDPQH